MSTETSNGTGAAQRAAQDASHDERLWWEKSMTRLNVVERERLTTMLDQLAAVREAWAAMTPHSRKIAPAALKAAMAKLERKVGR